MASFTKFNGFVEALAEKKHNLESDVLKVALTNTVPSATDTVFDPVTLHPHPVAQDGYAPQTPGHVTSAQSGGVYKLFLGGVTFTAEGNIGPFRYAILYNDTATNDELIAFYDYGSSVILLDGESFSVTFDAANGVLTLT